MYTSHVISMNEHLMWWRKQNSNAESILLVAEDSDGLVGVVNFTDYTGETGSATWAFYAGSGTEKGIGTRMENAALNYAFGVLLVRKLQCVVLSFNFQSR